VATFFGSHGSFRSLNVWQEAHSLTLKIYKTTTNFPKDERFGLIDQIRRCAASVGANIAEGSGRYSPKDQLHFHTIAKGSLAEVDNFVELAHDLHLISDEAYKDFCDHIGRVTGLLINLIKQRDKVAKSKL
jgi:four helix bundle protein